MAQGAKATIVDVARCAGVSKSTVSLVLQASPLIRPATAERVKTAIATLGYVYNRGAANLRKARSNVVGMVINDLTNPFFAELAVGMERVFQAVGMVPFIANTAENPHRQAQVLKSMLEQNVAGLIISPARGTARDAFGDLHAARVPVVLAMRRLPKSPMTTVSPDNRHGAFLAVDYLVKSGHRRIAMLGGFADMVVYRERLDGYADALAAHGLAVAPELVEESSANRRGGMAALRAVIRRDAPPTAALCFNDVVAFGAMLELRKMGREPGRDFAIVGFDDLVEAADHVPALTTVSVKPEALGEQAAQAVLRMIESQTLRCDDHVGPVHLVIRQSCGARLQPAMKVTA
ncbi:MAG: LacI family DNA-binding transcriptional regulator [Alphaproteobacteria bacterium]